MKTEISLEELKTILPDKGELIGDFIMGVSLILLALSVFSGTVSLRWGFLIIGFMCLMRVIDKIILARKLSKILQEDTNQIWNREY